MWLLKSYSFVVGLGSTLIQVEWTAEEIYIEINT